MPEYYKEVNVSAWRLNHCDLQRLSDIIRDGKSEEDFADSSFSFKINVVAGEKRYTDISIGNLISQNPPDRIDYLTMRFSDYESDNFIEVILGRIAATATVRSKNEIWFKGKLQQIIEFFKPYRKYHQIVRHLSFQIMSLCTILFSVLIGYYLADNRFVLVIAPVIGLILSLHVCWSLIRGNLLPEINIKLREKNKIINWNAWTFFVSAFVAILTILGLFFEIIKNYNNL